MNDIESICHQARPRAELLAEITNVNFAKNEREWAAREHIAKLEAEITDLRKDVPAWQLAPSRCGFYVVVNAKLFLRKVVEISDITSWRVDDGDRYYGPIPFSAHDIDKEPQQ